MAVHTGDVEVLLAHIYLPISIWFFRPYTEPAPVFSELRSGRGCHPPSPHLCKRHGQDGSSREDLANRAMALDATFDHIYHFYSDPSHPALGCFHDGCLPHILLRLPSSAYTPTTFLFSIASGYSRGKCPCVRANKGYSPGDSAKAPSFHCRWKQQRTPPTIQH